MNQFEYLLKKHGKRIKDVAADTGVPASTLSEWKREKYIPSVDKVKKVAAYFGVSMDYMIGNPNIPVSRSDSMITLPVIGEIRAGIPATAVENVIDYEQIPGTWLAEGEYFILQVIGDSMEDAGIKDGYRVLVKMQNTCDPGQIAVVAINDCLTAATIKRVFFSEDKIELVPANPKYPRMVYPVSQVSIIGIVKKAFFNL